MRSWRKTLTTLPLLALAGCSAAPRHAAIQAAHTLAGNTGRELEVVQQIQLTSAMRDALDHGIALRLEYRIETCGQRRQRALWLRHAPLKRQYELQREGATEVRDFPRLAALEAALDRVRLPLDLPADAACSGNVQVRLDLAALPTPLRFPAFFAAEQWQLASAPFAWPAS